MANVALIIESANNAPSGSFIGITDYISIENEISSITGQIGVSYTNAKDRAIAAMQAAITAEDFEAITVAGICRENPENKGEFNSRKRTWPMAAYSITYPKSQVIQCAKDVLEAYKNAERKTNKTQLSVKENAVYLENDTNNVNITVLVTNQTYKKEESKALKANAGTPDKPKATMPDSALKAIVRKRFSPRFKSFTIGTDNFTKLTIGGQVFN